MLINSKNFIQIDTKEKITIADSFVVRSNKLGNGNGEGKLYIGNEGEVLRNFYGPNGFKIKCFLLKQDLLKFLNDLKAEYIFPQLPYKKKEDLPSLFSSRLNKIQSLPEVLEFSIDEQVQIQGPRVYINSKDKNYQFLREIPLPDLSYISLMKLIANDGEIIYYIKLFTDFKDSFGVTSHPSTVQK